MKMWRCTVCQAEFQFIPCTFINGDIDRVHPEYCPYCGRESNFNASDRTTFESVGVAL